MALILNCGPSSCDHGCWMPRGREGYSMSLTGPYIKHGKDKGHEKGKGRLYRKQGRRWEVVDSLSRPCSRLWKRNLTGMGLVPDEQTGHPRRIKESGTPLWVTTHHSSTCPPRVQATLLSPYPADKHPLNSYSLLPNLLRNMARGQGTHEGAAGSEQGKDSARVGRVASTLPSLG